MTTAVHLTKYAQPHHEAWQPDKILRPLMTAIDVMSSALGTENPALVDAPDMTPITAHLINNLVEGVERISKATGKPIELHRFSAGEVLDGFAFDYMLDVLAEAIDVTPGYRVEWQIIGEEAL